MYKFDVRPMNNAGFILLRYIIRALRSEPKCWANPVNYAATLSTTAYAGQSIEDISKS